MKFFHAIRTLNVSKLLLYVSLFALLTERIISIILIFIDSERSIWNIEDFAILLKRVIAFILTVLSFALLLFSIVKMRGVKRQKILGFKTFIVSLGAVILACGLNSDDYILWLQVFSYATLIFSMLLRTLLYDTAETSSRQRNYFSFVYLFCILLTIPLLQYIVYPQTIFEEVLKTLAIVLTALYFSYSCYLYYLSGGKSNFSISFSLVVIALILPSIISQWKLQNLFLLVPSALMLIVAFLGRTALGNAELLNFYGYMRKAPYFEGWYFKLQKGDMVVALIPSYHVTNIKTFAMIQVVTPTKAFSFQFNQTQFDAQTDVLNVTVGRSTFSSRGVTLDINDDENNINGEIFFGKLNTLKKDIMGTFATFPLMQCKHGLISASHTLSGSLVINGKTYDFDGGTGYIEKDRGDSFPSRYFWTQCLCDDISIMLSIAEIPYFGLYFQGCICNVTVGSDEYILATYNGAKSIVTDRGAIVRKGEAKLEVNIINDSPITLSSPTHGEMSRGIGESPSAKVRYKFSVREGVLFDFIGNGSCEHMWNK